MIQDLKRLLNLGNCGKKLSTESFDTQNDSNGDSFEKQVKNQQLYEMTAKEQLQRRGGSWLGENYITAKLNSPLTDIQEERPIIQEKPANEFDIMIRAASMALEIPLYYFNPVNIDYTPQIPAVIKIQSYVKMRMIRRGWKKRLKQAVYRKHIIHELNNSELIYVADLHLVVDKIMGDIRQTEILDDIIFAQLFINMEQILKLNQSFSLELDKKYVTYFHHQNYSTLLNRYIPFFRVYYDYSQKFTLDGIQKQRSLNRSLNSYLEQIENEFTLLKGLNTEAYLIKPIQRIPKYILLLKDLIKHTEKCHPDYGGLKESLSKLQEVASGMNEKIEIALKTHKMFELQKNFGEPIGENFLEASRQFVFEESVNILHKESCSKSVRAYFLTDMVIVTEPKRLVERLYSIVKLNEQSFCKTPDIINSSYIFTVVGVLRTVTFMCESDEFKKKLMIQIEQLIHDLQDRQREKISAYERENQSLIVKCNKRYYSIKVIAVSSNEKVCALGNYTIYNMRITASTNNIPIAVRFSQLCELQRIVDRDFPKLDLPRLSKTLWPSSIRLVEGRKILAENYLQYLLSADEVKMNPDKVLTFLGLPLHFYDLCEIRDQLQDDSIQDLVNESFESYSSHNDQSMNNLLKFAKMGQQKASTSKLATCNAELLKEFRVGTNIEIRISLADGVSFKMDVGRSTLVQDIIVQFSRMIKIQTHYDFRLVLVDPNQNKRILNDTDVIGTLYQQLSNKSKESVIINSLLQKINQFFEDRSNNSYFTFRKFIFLDEAQEKVEYRNDSIFDDIVNHKYFFNQEEYTLYCSYYIFIKYHQIQDKIYTPNNMNIQYIKEFIPQKIFKNIKEQIWIDSIFLQLKQLRNEIKNILMIEKDPVKLASYILMESIQKHPLHGVQMYYVETYKQTKLDLMQQQKQQQITRQKLKVVTLPNNVYIGISYLACFIISPTDKSIIKRIELNQIEEPQFHPQFFSFCIKNILCRFRFNTTNSNEIKYLLSEYMDVIKVKNAFIKKMSQC